MLGADVDSVSTDGLKLNFFCRISGFAPDVGESPTVSLSVKFHKTSENNHKLHQQRCTQAILQHAACGRTPDTPNSNFVLPKKSPNVAPVLPHYQWCQMLPQFCLSVTLVLPQPCFDVFRVALSSPHQICPSVALAWSQCCPSVVPALNECCPNVAFMVRVLPQ